MPRQMDNQSPDPDRLVATKSPSDIRHMFDRLSSTYDFLNHLLSLNIDRQWRRTLAKYTMAARPKRILDVCTGTADLIIEMADLSSQLGYEPQFIGCDFARQMLHVAARKLESRKDRDRIALFGGDATCLPFKNDSFDLVTVAFGIRNVHDLVLGVQELIRVTRRGGQIAILEFSQPDNKILRCAYNLYFLRILPMLGWLVTGTKAYVYLPHSVQAFPYGKEFVAILESCGLRSVKAVPLTRGVATLYLATKAPVEEQP